MKFLALLVFCGFVKSVPLIEQPDTLLFAFEDGIYNEDAQYLDKKSASDHCPKLLNSEDDENVENPSRLSLPTLITLSNEDAPQDLDVDRIVFEMIYQPVGDMLPTELGEKSVAPLPLIIPRVSPWNRWMNDMNDMQDPRIATTEGLTYQLPSYISENIVTSLQSPPSGSMQIHETLNEIGENYDIVDSDRDNSFYLPTNVRAVRSREEELLEQLKHEAMIPNIIPTMPVPFVRTVGASPVYQTGQDARGSGLAMALFPGRVSDCALPFLVDCSPKVAYGSFPQTPYYGRYPSISIEVPSTEYRKEAITGKNHKVNQVL